MSSKDYEAKHNTLFTVYCVLLAILPLPLGSNRPWSWSLMALVSMMLIFFWTINYLYQPYKLPVSAREAKPAIIAMGIWLGYIFFQYINLPLGLLKSMSPASYELYQFASVTDGMGSKSISVDRGETLTQFVRAFTYISLFFLTVTIASTRKRVKTVARVLFYTGVFGSIYGLFNTLSGVEYIWGTPKTAYVGFVSGTFISRNHFAGHLEMVIPFGLVLMFFGGNKIKEMATFQDKLKFWVNYILNGRARKAVFLLIMFSALFLSGSRGGNGAFFIALAVIILLAVFLKGRQVIEARVAPVIFGAGLLAAAWLGLGALPDRLAMSQANASSRYAAWEIAQTIISDFTITGSGAGTFKALSNVYNDGTLLGYYDHAHNDYLELLCDQGIIGFFLGAFIVIFMLLKIVKGYKVRNNEFYRGIIFASLVGSLSMLLHALVDFNFQIPANAAYFVVILGLGLVASSVKHSKHRSDYGYKIHDGPVAPGKESNQSQDKNDN